MKVLEDVREAGARELSQVTTFDTTPDFARETVEASCKYMNYMDRQVKEMEGWRRNQEFRWVRRKRGPVGWGVRGGRRYGWSRCAVCGAKVNEAQARPAGAVGTFF